MDPSFGIRITRILLSKSLRKIDRTHGPTMDGIRPGHTSRLPPPQSSKKKTIYKTSFNRKESWSVYVKIDGPVSVIVDNEGATIGSHAALGPGATACLEALTTDKVLARHSLLAARVEMR